MEILYWYAVTLVTAGELDRALPIFKQVFQANNNWKVLTPRLVDVDLLPDDMKTLEKIMAQ